MIFASSESLTKRVEIMDCKNSMRRILYNNWTFVFFIAKSMEYKRVTIFKITHMHMARGPNSVQY